MLAIAKSASSHRSLLGSVRMTSEEIIGATLAKAIALCKMKQFAMRFTWGGMRRTGLPRTSPRGQCNRYNRKYEVLPRFPGNRLLHTFLEILTEHCANSATLIVLVCGKQRNYESSEASCLSLPMAKWIPSATPPNPYTTIAIPHASMMQPLDPRTQVRCVSRQRSRWPTSRSRSTSIHAAPQR